MKTTLEIANRLVELCRNGEFIRAEKELYADTVLHIEINGQEFKGFDAALQKEKQFLDTLKEAPMVEISNPVVAGNYFTISMYMTAKLKNSEQRTMDEIIVYKTENDKIVFLRCYA